MVKNISAKVQSSCSIAPWSNQFTLVPTPYHTLPSELVHLAKIAFSATTSHWVGMKSRSFSKETLRNQMRPGKVPSASYPLAGTFRSPHIMVLTRSSRASPTAWEWNSGSLFSVISYHEFSISIHVILSWTHASFEWVF